LGSEPAPGLAVDGLPVAAFLAVEDRSVTAVLLSFQGTPLDPPEWRGLRLAGARGECRRERHSLAKAEVSLVVSAVGRHRRYRGAFGLAEAGASWLGSASRH
jgi:hypothetical protein